MEPTGSLTFLCEACGGVLAAAIPPASDSVTCPYCTGVTTVPETRFSPRAVVGEFVIECGLGEGGMATVYAARQLSLDRRVALKILKPDLPGGQDAVADFLREAQAAASLNHPHVVQVYAVGEDQGVHFIAMEHVEGESLLEQINRRGRIPAVEAAGLVLQVADGLRVGWETRNLIHLDVTPDNILVTADGNAKLTDLGLARFRTAPDADQGTGDEFLGTPGYIAPERIAGDPVTHCVDVFGLGATFYHAVTGRGPFTGATPLDIAASNLLGIAPPPHEIASDVPAAVSMVIQKMMAREPTQRFATARDVCAALEQALDSEAEPGRVAFAEQLTTLGAWHCPVCQGENAPQNAYCIYCGTAGYEACPACGIDIRPALQFCPGCGASVGEQRQELAQQTHEILRELESALHDGDLEQIQTVLQQLAEVDRRMLQTDHRQQYDDVRSAVRVWTETVFFDACGKYDLEIAEAAAAILGTFSEADMREEAATALDEFKQSRRELKWAVMQAATAMDRNCLSRAGETLGLSPPWCGGVLGDQRDRLLVRCKTRLDARVACMGRAEELLAAEEFEELLELLPELALFRPPPRMPLLNPSRGDTEFGAAVEDLQSRLSVALLEAVSACMTADHWDNTAVVTEMLTCLGSPYARQILAAIHQQGLQELTRRCQRAAVAEARKDMRKAEACWRSVLRVPEAFLGADERAAADGFALRRDQFRKQILLRLAAHTALAAATAALMLFAPSLAVLMRHAVETPAASADALIAFLPLAAVLTTAAVGERLVVRAGRLHPPEQTATAE